MREMTEEEFIAIVKKSEQEAGNNLGAYKFKLALFALLGYAVIFGVLTLLTLLIGGSVAIAFISSSLLLLLIKKKIIFAIAFAIWTFIRALWVRFEPPTGRTLERQQAPILFDVIDELTQKLNALKIHQVIVRNNFNAAVVQSPKLGIFGKNKNTLILGLPLMLALSPEAMKSVLAHEFGHLSGNHSRFSGWIYRIRFSWQRIMHALEATDSFGAGLMRKFFDWYAPKFSAYSFALARRNEYDADNVAVELTSKSTAAQALVAVHAKADYLEEQYWTPYFKQADTQPSPNELPYKGLAEFLKKSILSHSELEANIQEALKVQTHYADTHPALQDRLDAIGTQVTELENYDTSSAEAWLGNEYLKLLKEFDDEWLEATQERWQNRYQYANECFALINEAKEHGSENFDEDKLWQLAQATREFESSEKGLAIYHQFLTRQPDSIGANFYIGLILAEQKNEDAIKYLRVALGSPNTFEEAGHCGYRLLDNLGEKQRAAAWWQEVVAAGKRHQLAYEAHASCSLHDNYRSPMISSELRQKITEQMAAHKNIGKVWLAQKVVDRAISEAPVYILCFKPKGFNLSYSKMTQSVIETLECEETLFAVCLYGDNKALGKRVKQCGVQIL